MADVGRNDPSQETSPAMAAWYAFSDKDYEERLALVEERLGDDARMDDENAFETFIALYDESFERGGRARVTALTGLASASAEICAARSEEIQTTSGTLTPSDV
ncbi:MAG: hypothetical protein BRD46_01595 [Bacteroidetes bacterium QS_8_68_15]|nr:MAG: hypothetical protein BRD46_01595 [Bacteroidetes bacterium QS_8_68_15]